MIIGKPWDQYVVFTLMWTRWLFGCIGWRQWYVGPVYVALVPKPRPAPRKFVVTSVETNTFPLRPIGKPLQAVTASDDDDVYFIKDETLLEKVERMSRQPVGDPPFKR